MSEERDDSGAPAGAAEVEPQPAGDWATIETRAATEAWAAARGGVGALPTAGDPRLGALSALEVAVALGMQRHREGGYFRETYRSAITIETDAGRRPLMTTILYLLTAAEPSRFHRLRSDELWLYHAGVPAELVVLVPGAPEYHVVCLTSPQVTIPGNRWMGGRVMPEDEADWGEGRAPERRWTPDRRATRELRWTLVSCLVAPGFDYEDFELGERAELLRDYPRAKHAILALT
jgi:predicted cupin superfamily sugar epimerase